MKQNVPSQLYQWEPSRQSLVSILGENHYTPGEFIDSLGAPSFRALVKSVQPLALPFLNLLIKAHARFRLSRLGARSKMEIQSYTFSYRSHTVDGREIEMSGRVTFLSNKEEGTPHQVKTISLHSHQALLDNGWAPSENLTYAPLKVLWDSAVIEPDFQKWGINYTKEPDGGGSSLHMGRQLADCTVAALEVMQQHGVTLAPDGYTTNWGTSQGTMPALQFAKWYDTQAPQWFRDALRLHSTFAAEAAVDIPEGTKIEYQHPENISLEFIALVGYFQAFTPEQMGGYKPEDFLPEWMLEKKYTADGKQISFFDAVNCSYSQITDPVIQQITSFDQVVAPDMLTEDGKVDFDCPKLVTWFSCLKEHNYLEDWTPQLPVYLAHSPKDDMLPYELAYELYRIISDQGKSPNVHMLSIPFPSIIPTGGMLKHSIIAVLLQFYIVFLENPEDTRRLYKTVR